MRIGYCVLQYDKGGMVILKFDKLNVMHRVKQVDIYATLVAQEV